MWQARKGAPRAYQRVAVSPDGTRLALDIRDEDQVAPTPSDRRSRASVARSMLPPLITQTIFFPTS